MTALALLTAANTAVYLAASILHTGLTIPLGPVTLGFPAPSTPATVAEGLIGAVLGIAAVTLFGTRSTLFAWGAYVFALLGTLLGLSIILLRGIGGPDLWVHFVMLAGLSAGFVLLGRAGRRARDEQRSDRTSPA